MNIYELEKFSPGQWYYDVHSQLRDHTYGRASDGIQKGDEARDRIDSIEKIIERQAFVLESITESLGTIPDTECELDPVVTGVLKRDGYRIEKLIFQSRPKVYITANMYIPDGLQKPTGAVLFLSGHHEQAKHVPEYQLVCQRLVKSGLIVLSQDPIGQGERFSYYNKSTGETTVTWGTREHDYAGTQCWPLGDSIARYFVHDAMRGVDYLISRPEVDPDKIGVTGNSGGGTQTCLMMLCDRRIAAAAPATFLMNRKTYMYVGGAQDSEQIWPGLTAYGIDHEDIMISMVPKPVLILSVRDDFFPIEGPVTTYERTKRFWEMSGASENVGIYIDKCWHTYTENLAKAAAEFFTLHLLGKKAAQESITVLAEDPKTLYCTQSGQVSADYPDARFVHDENLVRLALINQEKGNKSDKQLKSDAFEWLRSKVFDKRETCDLNCRFFLPQKADELDAQLLMWRSQHNLMNYSILFRNSEYRGSKLPVIIAVWDGGTSNLVSHMPWIRENCAQGRVVMVLDTTGSGNIAPNRILTSLEPLHFYGVIFKLNHELMWLDDSLAATRVYDVTRAVDVLTESITECSEDISIYCEGKHGMYSLLATFLDKRILKISEGAGIIDCAQWVGARHYDPCDISSISMRGMLRYFDLPDIRRWIAADRS